MSFIFPCRHNIYNLRRTSSQPGCTKIKLVYRKGNGNTVEDELTNNAEILTRKAMFSRGNSEDALSSSHSISQDWLEAVLRKYYSEDGKTAKVEIRSLSTKEGCDPVESVLSDIIALAVDVNINEEKRNLHFIIKLLPLDPFSRYFVAESQFDLREIKFYTQIAPELETFQKNFLPENEEPITLPIPKCYFAKYLGDDESPDNSPTTPTGTEESVIILEDLKHQDYVNVDFVKGLSLEQTQSAFEAVSRLHALSLAMKVKEKESLCERYDFLFHTEKASDSYQQLIDRGMPQLTKFLEKHSDMQQIIERLTALRPNTKHLIESLLAPEEPMSLITHTDFWCNNLLFKGDKCIILDWQMVTCSQPTNDLALLLISSVPTDIRRQHTVKLLDHYWHHLVRYSNLLGVDIENQLGYNRARLTEDYRRSQLLSLLLCIGSVDVAFGNSETEQRLIDVLLDLYKDGVLSSDIVRIHYLNV